MEKVNVRKEILIVLLIAVAVFTISSTVLATGTASQPVEIPNLRTDATPANEQNTNQNAVENTTTTNTTENTVKAANITGSTYQNTTLPQTGDASDYAIFAVIAVSAVVAVYAYRKVRNYNI